MGAGLKGASIRRRIRGGRRTAVNVGGELQLPGTLGKSHSQGTSERMSDGE